MYTDPGVIDFIAAQFVPVRVHVREQQEDFQRLGARFGAQWTPTVLVIDHTAEERHRLEGFLPAGDFLGQLTLGLAKSAFARGDFQQAERWFTEVVERHPGSDAAPEALYWAGVSRYKTSGDALALAQTAEAFQSRYPGSSWAKKASVWGRPVGV